MDDDQRRTIDYMVGILRELRSAAENRDLNMLAYFIEMALIEALEIGDGLRPAHFTAKDRKPISQPTP